VLISDIYPAGEKPIPGVDANTIIERVREHGQVMVEHVPSFEDMVARVAGATRPGDVVLTMGAGDIYTVGDLMLAALAAEAPERKG
jgi:UDP-N-acetylmuramate--alanine ligase